MEYSLEDLEQDAQELGEIFLVTDGGFEHEIHGTNSYEVVDEDRGLVEVEGIDDEGELVMKRFSVDNVEYIYTHREV